MMLAGSFSAQSNRIIFERRLIALSTKDDGIQPRSYGGLHNEARAFLPHKVVGNFPPALLLAPPALWLPVFCSFQLWSRYGRAALDTRQKW